MVFTLFSKAFEDAVVAWYHSCLSSGTAVETPEIS